MKKSILLLFVSVFTILLFAEIKTAKDGEYTYEYVENDPLNARIYTLQNGLKVYLSDYKDAPRIQTYIAVKTGSRNDPSDATGLAHYLEHMVFKGTSKMGTSNWEKEKAVLKQISDTYEKRRTAKSQSQRDKLYKKIDKLSYEASKFAISNEYDKMISSLGAKGTNAYTSVDQTVYVNDIPSTELEKFLKIEGERFSELVLRLFHTELETVYEEFNRANDNDNRKVFYTLFKNLYSNHPYGTQTTIGTGEHLKNPSMEKIHKYFNTYYVPNNMAVCLSGDLNYSETIKLVDKYFGKLKTKEVPKFEQPERLAITAPIVKTVKGREAAMVEMAFKFKGANSKEADLMLLVDGILANGAAGLIDLNLVKQQKVLSASSGYWVKNDYSTHFLFGNPKEGQTLEEVKSLLLNELEKVKKGEFDDWLIKALINDYKYSEIKGLEMNRNRANAFVSAFINETPWDNYVARYDNLEKYTKQDIMDFASKMYNNNYVQINKVQEEDEVTQFAKPKITPIVTEREKQSVFFKEVATVKSKRMQPQFLDYSTIDEGNLKKNVPFTYLKNELNKTFSLSYILDMGKNHDQFMALAIDYLPYLGTEKYSAEDLQKEFFKLGLSFDVNASEDQIYVSLSGLEESLNEGIKLFEHILANVKPDQAAYDKFVSSILKKRKDTKTNKNRIMWGGLMNFAKYGKNSSFTDVLSENRLKGANVNELVNKIKSLTKYKHRVFYYGQKDKKAVRKILKKNHKVAKYLNNYPSKKQYKRLETTKNNVYLVDYPEMAQAQILMLNKGEKYNKTLETPRSLFNEYFGSGLSSIVFQEIRESKALAYSAFSAFSNPRKVEDPHFTYAFLGTQADKFEEAYKALSNLMNDMPMAEIQFNAAKDAAMKKIESDKITRSNVFWNYEAAKKKNLNYDIRKEIYNNMKNFNQEDLKKFFNENIKGNNYSIMILCDKSAIDMEYLNSFDNFKELKLEEIFGY